MNRNRSAHRDREDWSCSECDSDAAKFEKDKDASVQIVQ